MWLSSGGHLEPATPEPSSTAEPRVLSPVWKVQQASAEGNNFEIFAVDEKEVNNIKNKIKNERNPKKPVRPPPGERDPTARALALAAGSGGAGSGDEDEVLEIAAGKKPNLSGACPLPVKKVKVFGVPTARTDYQTDGYAGERTTPAHVPPSIAPSKPPKKVLKCVGQALRAFGMIREGDKLLVGLSGGKDSLSLLHVLMDLQKRAPVRFELATATVDPQADEFDPSKLGAYVAALGIPHHLLSEPIVMQAEAIQPSSICAFCSRMRRGLLYTCAQRHGYTALVLGHHLDDLAESFLMASFNNGQLTTMKAHYLPAAKNGLRVIRPLVYTREADLRAFSREAQFPLIEDNCPACFEAPLERARVKRLLAQQELEIPTLFSNLLHSMGPLLAIGCPPLELAILDSATIARLRRSEAAAAGGSGSGSGGGCGEAEGEADGPEGAEGIDIFG